MATAKKENDMINDSITFVAEEKKESYHGPMVSVFLPRLEEDSSGMKVDQYEHVTLANEQEIHTWQVKRGVHVDVPVPVFVILKDKYPDI